VFLDREVTKISTAELIEGLVDIIPRPWAEYGKGGKPITQNRLARLLKPLGIAPERGVVILDDGAQANVRSYHLEHFREAFARFLPMLGGAQLDKWKKLDGCWTSEASATGNGESSFPVAKSQKSNNDGEISTCPVAEGGAGDMHTSAESEPCAARSPESAPEPPELCARCNRPGGNVVAFGDGESIRLHPKCERPWIEERMAQEGIWSASPG
jgi:Protein of unknown function (DUF3631)